MKLTRIILGAVLGLFVFFSVVFVLAGILLPDEKSYTEDTEIAASRETLWQVLRNVKSYPEWQDKLTGVEIEDKDHWTEIAKNVGRIEFRVVKSEKPSVLEIKYSTEGGMNGEWRGVLKSEGDHKTIITTTDKSIVTNWVTKVFMSMFFDIEEFAKDWNLKLKKRAESVELRKKKTGDDEE